MQKRKPHSTSLVLLLVCIFTFWWGISVLAQHDTSGPLASFNQSSSAPSTANTAPITVRQTNVNGTYTYSGTFIPASPCDSFGSGVRFIQANGGHVAVLLDTEPAAAGCAQASGNDSGEPFSVSVKSKLPQPPQFDGVLLNGTPIPSQLVTGN
ncbi:MAG TPA: hypothetical protein VN665_03845 [Candidatus Paceibacterota bacterium]|nr:hypothetical protein [Candidatus Paceibacterota bacterium]